MQPELLYADFPRYEELPDDDAELDTLIAMVDGACGVYVWPGNSLPQPLPDNRAKRLNAWRVASSILFYGFLVFLIVGAFFISRGDKKPVFGYSFANVLTWSMEPDIPQGSLIIVKRIDPNAIQIGDDITYMKDAAASVTHRVIGIVENYGGSGARGFETQGINNETPDFEIVPAGNVAGVVKSSIPGAGSWLDWLRGHLMIAGGFALGILLLAILLRGAFKAGPAEDKKLHGKRKHRLPQFKYKVFSGLKVKRNYVEHEQTV